MKNIFKFFGTILTVVLAAFCMTGCLAEDDLGTADLGLHVKVFFPTKVVAGQPMTINGSGFADATAIVFPGVDAEVVVTDFQIVSNDMIRVNAPKGISAEGGKIIVRTESDQAESPLPLTLGDTKISGYSANAGDQVDGGSQITIFGTDLEFITGVELLDADGNPALISDKLFNKKATASIIFTVPKKVYEGTFVGKVYTIDGKTFEMPELTYKPAADGGYWETQKIMIWENDGSLGQIGWSSEYRFALEGMNGNGDAVAAELPADKWDIIKNGTFYITVSGETFQIRTTTGWWSFDGDGVHDIHNGDERLVDNGDGTFSIHAGGGYSDGSTNFACIVTNESTYAVRNWTWDDHGSVLYIIENPNIEVEDIISTGIESLPTTIENLSRKGIYNLHGQKLVALPKQGVVIVDGKKKIIK